MNNSAARKMKTGERICVRGILATAASPWAGTMICFLSYEDSTEFTGLPGGAFPNV